MIILLAQWLGGGKQRSNSYFGSCPAIITPQKLDSAPKNVEHIIKRITWPLTRGNNTPPLNSHPPATDWKVWTWTQSRNNKCICQWRGASPISWASLLCVVVVVDALPACLPTEQPVHPCIINYSAVWNLRHPHLIRLLLCPGMCFESYSIKL